MVIGAEGDPIVIPVTRIVGCGSVTFSVCAAVEPSGNPVEEVSSLLLMQESVIRNAEMITAARVTYEIVLRLTDKVFIVVQRVCQYTVAHLYLIVNRTYILIALCMSYTKITYYITSRSSGNQNNEKNLQFIFEESARMKQTITAVFRKTGFILAVLFLVAVSIGVKAPEPLSAA